MYFAIICHGSVDHRMYLALYPVPEGGGKRAWYPLHAHAPTTPRKPGVLRTTVTTVCFFALLSCLRVIKCTVVHSTPGFLGVAGACTCNRYQAFFPPPSGSGYKAKDVPIYLPEDTYIVPINNIRP